MDEALGGRTNVKSLSVCLITLFVLVPTLCHSEVSSATVSAATPSSTTPCCQQTTVPGQPIENLKIETHGAATIIINSNVKLEGGSLSTTQTVSPGQGEAEKKPGAKPSGGKPSGEKPEEKKPYEDLIKDATKEEGLFKVFLKEDKVLWEIEPAKFDDDYLFSVKVGKGVGTLFPGAVLGSKVLNLRRLEEKVQIIERHHRYQADEDSPIKRGVERAYGESIIAAFPIAATNPANNSPVIDIRPFLLSDFAHLGRQLQGVLGLSYGLDKENSDVEKVKTFPENIEIYTKLFFKSGQPADVKAVADSSSARVLLRLSFRELPESDFQPRLADDRVGYFIEAYQDLSDLESKTQYVRNITRWNIEKASPEAEISPPKKPLVFWIENTVPHQYREAAKEGVEMWNKAFEKAGFKKAVVAKQMPDDADWDPEDSRYHMVHWDTVEGLPFAGLAQWVSNPLTGQIVDCDVIIDGGIVQYLRRLRRLLVEPVQEHTEDGMPHRCQYGMLLAQETQRALGTLAARGEISDATIEEFIKDYIRSVICHEVGHILGLRHNFVASTMLDLDELHDKEITSEKGLTSSIMDYTPLNLAPEGKEQGHYWAPCVGPYDCWAIQCGYTPLSATSETEQKEELEEILSKYTDPELKYLTDEDLWTGSPMRPLGLDPTNAWFDLSSDTIGWDEQQMEIMQNAWENATEVVQEGEPYYDMRNAVGVFLGYYRRYATDMARYIGGAYVTRTRAGNRDDRLPMEPVPASTQRRAMTVLAERVFSDEPFHFSPKILNMLIDEKWYHWGIGWGALTDRTDYPLHDVILNMRRNVLYRLFDPLILSRIREGEQKIGSGEEAYTIPDLFTDLTDAIWGDIHNIVESEDLPRRSFTNTSPLISSHRRALQREYVKMLTNLMLRSGGQTPEDARTHAWNVLTTMRDDIESLMNEGWARPLREDLDQYSLVHLKETAATITRALEARMDI